MMKRSVLISLTCLLAACGGGESAQDSAAKQSQIEPVNLVVNKPVPDNHNAQAYAIALIGNSHAAGLVPYLQDTIEHYVPEKPVSVEALGFGFTDDLYNNAGVHGKLREGGWTHLIIQGQKYSQSGTVLYSTEATQQWIALAKDLGITPILFPEHPQRGRTQEAEYIMGIHQGIANKQASCIAPIGLAWDAAIQHMPNVPFHTADGNHGAPSGLLLSSLIFSEIITAERVDTGPISIIPNTILGIEQQGALSQIASQVLVEQPACD
ncbi:hypothetical protein [Pseudoalteromonas luteoviolacea]|uniref:SGNH/GDSL hydrolase family protein n=1 Tax=Pseudoalteromonas luteoviolacea S4060-1 TaxID=1365257 RepID=A0A162B2T4_9GAMM|nr:hypothetical protein [Pseudoalteromonas luteoviolacea]KZN65593.1 hypothetical protein N478_21070 [Pseudoalteromonas luteoviolacea S4060-1]